MAKKRQKRSKPIREVQEAIKEKASTPSNNTQADIDACKARVAEGAKCYCRDECHCRRCQEVKKSQGSTLM